MVAHAVSAPVLEAALRFGGTLRHAQVRIPARRADGRHARKNQKRIKIVGYIHNIHLQFLTVIIRTVSGIVSIMNP